MANFEPVTRIEKLLSEIAENTRGGGGGGGGAGLPAVTSEDNGDVLTVVDGAWDKAAPSGGVFVIAANYDEATGKTSLDHTWQEIWDAFAAGMMPAILGMETDEYGAEAWVQFVTQLGASDGQWGVLACRMYYSPYDDPPGGVDGQYYFADTADGYPSDSTGDVAS